MVKLVDYRRWLEGEDIDGLPGRGLNNAIAITFIPKGKYDIQSDGLDARLKFGEHKGKLVSRMAADSDGSTYLSWMLSEDFPQELKEAIEYQVEKQRAVRVKRPKRQGKRRR